MEKHEASYLSRRKKCSIKVDKSSKETILELPEQCVLQSFSDTSDNEFDLWEFVSLKRHTGGKGLSSEDPQIDSCGESLSRSSSDNDSDETEAVLEAISRSWSEKKRSLGARVIEPAPLQDFRPQKKCKPDESPKLKADIEAAAVADLHDKSGVPKAPVTGKSTPEKQDSVGSSGKRKLSREDQKSEVEGITGEGNGTRKRRKTKWTGDDLQLKILGPIQLPSLGKDTVTSDQDPEIQELKVELFEINNKLQRPGLHDDCPEDRSPSPEPACDSLGNRKNIRERGLREKLIQKRQSIISRLIGKNSTFKPAADYKPPKLIKKLYIPEKEYPGYNFVGLIIGPRGSTQKRMEKETGAKILLRGRGYSLRTARRTKPSDNEDLHVRIEAENQNSFDAAVRMVEKLLIPIDQGTKAHLKSTFETSLSCEICGSSNHATPSCPLIASSQGSNPQPVSSGPEISSTPGTQGSKGTSDADIYVGHLPQSMDENCLAELFAPFGKVAKARVIRERGTGISKGYGFVSFENPAHAALALSYMHGHKLDGKTLAVREGTRQWGASSSSMSPDTNHPQSVAASQEAVCHQTGWSGPPAVSLPQHQSLFPETKGMTLHPPYAYYMGPPGFFPDNHGLGFPPAPFISNLQGERAVEYGYIAAQVPFSSSGSSLPQFSGVPTHPGSQFKSYFATQAYNPFPSFYISPMPGSHLKPFPWPTTHLAKR